MAARASQDKRARGRRVLRFIRLSAAACAATIALGVVIYAAERTEQFLIRDPRFFLQGPADYGQPSPSLFIEGATYTSRWQIQRVFERDFGRSILLLPLSERRRDVARLSWVKDDFIRRTWPNRITVSIVERRPAAFIQIPFGRMSRYALIDTDGVILDQPLRARFDLPLVAGISPADPIDARADGVRRMQAVLTAFGNLASGISEVDVADPADIRVRQEMDNHSVLLMLGEQNFASRMQTFLDRYPAIHKRAPRATTFDLRIDDRITAVTEGGSNAG